MMDAIRRVDGLLRAQSKRPTSLEDEPRTLTVGTALLACIVLGAIAGACTGAWSVINREDAVLMQAVASAVKVPLLFLLTLVVTFPSLYVFGALLGVALRPEPMLRLILASMVVTTALVASFGPITTFFALGTDHYAFMVLLNVVAYGFAGTIGLACLLRSLRNVSELGTARAAFDSVDRSEVVATDAAAADSDSDSEPDPATPPPPPVISPQVQSAGSSVILCRVWVVVYGLVGAQMAWVLRPFIGTPDAPFSWFRQRESNFFQAVFGHLGDLLGMGGG